jgi:2-oxoglutarate ferredoxin oxidoreductase subunit beta
METIQYTSDQKPTWCPSCGDFGILSALNKTFQKLNIPSEEIVLVAGIGCGSLLPYFVKTYGLCTLHGRAIPVATGIKIANHNLKVIVNTGDGDGLGIGVGHFVHFFRRNLDITVILDNNGVYGLTKGQTAPTSRRGSKTSSTPHGSLETPVPGIALALTMGATFVARAYSADQPGLTSILEAAMNHRGSSFVDIIQPCPTFNPGIGYEFYKDHIQKLDQEFSERSAAITFALQESEKIYTGIFFREDRPTYEDEVPALQGKPLTQHDIENISVQDFLERRS